MTTPTTTPLPDFLDSLEAKFPSSLPPDSWYILAVSFRFLFPSYALSLSEPLIPKHPFED